MTLFVRNVTLNRQTVNLLVEEGTIQAVGDSLSPPDSSCPTLDGKGMNILPGLVNGHTHAAMTLLRGYGDDMALQPWLETKIWPAEAKLNAEDIYWGTKLACLEMIRSGTVSFQDMYWYFPEVAKAVDEMGIRAGIGAVLIDVAGEEQGEELKSKAREAVALAKSLSPRISCTLAPHAIYTVSQAMLRWVAEFSEENNLLVHIHLSETEQEVNDCIKNHGVRPAVYLDQVGLLTPRTLLAHGVWLEDQELDLIAQRGSTIVTNPVSNMKLAVGGVFPFKEAHQRGIPIALGTDGTASNNSLDLFQDLKTFALIQKHSQQDAALLTASQAMDIATGKSAPLLGQTGEISPGAPADFLLIRPDEVEITPTHNPTSNWVYAATGHVVDTVVIAGKVVMQNRHVEGEEEIIRQVKERAKKLESS